MHAPTHPNSMTCHRVHRSATSEKPAHICDMKSHPVLLAAAARLPSMTVQPKVQHSQCRAQNDARWQVVCSMCVELECDLHHFSSLQGRSSPHPPSGKTIELVPLINAGLVSPRTNTDPEGAMWRQLLHTLHPNAPAPSLMPCMHSTTAQNRNLLRTSPGRSE